MAKNRSSRFDPSEGLSFTSYRSDQESKPSLEDILSNAKPEIKAEKEMVDFMPDYSADLPEDPEAAYNLPKKKGRPNKAENEKLRGYRFNLNLDIDLREFVHDKAWRKRTSITQYVCDLIRADMEQDEEWKGRRL